MVLRASIVTIDPVVGVTTETPVVNVDYILLVAAVVLDASGRFSFIVDAVAVVEGVALHVTKEFVDTTTVDETARLQTTKPVFDSTQAQESFAREVVFIRAFNHAVAAQEQIAKAFARPNLIDAAAAEEAISLTPEKGLTDTVAAAEAVDQFDISKALSDQVLAFDALTAFEKDKILDTTSTVDTVKAKIVGKVFEDLFDVAEAAVIEAGKGLFDVVDVADDTLAFDAVKSLLDAAAVVDLPALTTSRPDLVDSVASTDTPVLFSFDKGLAHSVSMDDNFTFDLLLGDTIPLYDFAFVADGKFTSFPVPGTINSHLVHEPLVNGETVLTTDPNAGIVYTIRVESDSFMFSGYTLNGDQLN